MKKYILFSLTLFVYSSGVFSQDTLSLLFIGDIMGHGTQIKAAYNPQSKSYSYDDVFKPMKPVIEQADFAIANLEVTLAGPPYKGYPQFSSPDIFALDCKNNGIDAMVTSNNHACDKGKIGVTRTIWALDSMKIPHTGTFLDTADRKKRNLMVLEKNNIRIGILNYTYGTNSIPTPKPTFINRIDTALMRTDILKAQNDGLDKLIVFVHWGVEYQHQPNAKQKSIAKFLFDQGVDYIIGSHPHVVQPMEYYPADSLQKERFIAYSLGNFVSNQRTTGRDGGAIVKLTIVKDSANTRLAQSGYQLTWVKRTKDNGRYAFEILPVCKVEKEAYKGLNTKDADKLKRFTKVVRPVLDKNKNVPELDHEGKIRTP